MDSNTGDDRENSESTSTNNTKKERNFPALDLKDQATLSTDTQPVLVVHSPKTPTLSRKLKAVSLDSEPQPQTNTLEVSRDVFSMPNTPKRQFKQKLSCDFDDGAPKSTLAPSFSSNLKKFASNNSISGSQTLKTLPEINALQDFSDCPTPEPQKIRAKGLLERRGSNASLTIDLGSSQNITEVKPVPLSRLNTAKSVSNLYLSSMSTAQQCVCVKKCEAKVNSDRRKSQEACGNCTIYESVPKVMSCKARCQNLKRCSCCSKSRRKSLSNENLYVPPCGFCENESKESLELRNCKGNSRKAVFPRQPDLEASQLLSDDFKLHLQNIQYLQTAGNILSIPKLKQVCERVPKLHQEFWEVPLNLQEKCYVSGSQSKNRYKGVLPNEHSRVPLPVGGYIHANYIKGPDYTETAYIATQGPLSNTCTDFWEMVWYSQCKCIVMLTGLVEKGRNKCELYFPLGKKSDSEEKSFLYVKTAKVRDKFTFEQKNYTEYDTEIFEFEEKNHVTFGKYHISYVTQRDLDECQIRHLELRKTDASIEPRLIYHYWFNNWPDHKMANPEQVLKMAVDVLDVIEGIKSDSNLTKRNNDDDEEVFSINVSKKEQSCVNKEAGNSKFDLTCNSDRKNNISQGISTNNVVKTTNENSRFSFNVTSEKSTVSFSNIVDIRRSKTEFLYTSTNESSVGLSSHKQRKKVVNENLTKECSVSTTVTCQEDQTNTNKSREGSISDFNKETLSNRCSLDSKLGNLNKISDFKSQFTRHERKKSAEHIKLPVVVHCSAGIGRTGCFLAILNGIQQLKSNNNVDVLAILCSLRLNRGGMVQNAEQYELIHRVLRLYSESI